MADLDMNEPRERHCYLTVVEFYNLRLAVHPVIDEISSDTYLVGSCLDRANYRDVDVRCIVHDDFLEQIPDTKLLSVAISEWISQRSGLNVDFQIQSVAEANKYDGKRNWLG